MEIVAGIETIANDPSKYPGGIVPQGVGRVRIVGSIKGVQTAVIVDANTNEVITAWPEGASQPLR
jgi:hypothetical protein